MGEPLPERGGATAIIGDCGGGRGGSSGGNGGSKTASVLYGSSEAATLRNLEAESFALRTFGRRPARREAMAQGLSRGAIAHSAPRQTASSMASSAPALRSLSDESDE